jgi:hypothetical protein
LSVRDKKMRFSVITVVLSASCLAALAALAEQLLLRRCAKIRAG